MKLNVKTAQKSRTKEKTFEGAPAYNPTAEKQLRRAVLSCLLWEDTFYEDGVSIADRIKTLVPKVSPNKVMDLAIEARSKFNMRHVPLYLMRELARKAPKGYKEALVKVIQRADELTEFLAIYWKDGKEVLASQVKKGLAEAFKKFDEYSLAKYNRDGNVKLKDVLFLCHAKPENKKQEKLWKKLIDGKLESPDTWEVALSAGKDKKATFERLIKEESLGAMALLRNLRNMKEAGVNSALIFDALEKANVKRVLPMRFISAARHAPQWEDKIEKLMFTAVKDREKLSGRTVLLVDVSGSMDSGTISSKSELRAIDVACGLGILARELCEDIAIYTFSDKDVLVPSRRGFALRDAIIKSQPHNGTYLFKSIDSIVKKEKADRLIVITDEQSHDSGKYPYAKNYVITVGPYKNGVGYGKNVVRIEGWSDAILDYILQTEKDLND